MQRRGFEKLKGQVQRSWEARGRAPASTNQVLDGSVIKGDTRKIK